MRCPACNAENPEGAATCASCGAALGAAAAPAAVAAPDQPATSRESAAAPARRRLSKLAVFAIVAAAVAPWLQVLTIESGGRSWLGRAAAHHWQVLMALDYGAYALFAAAAVTSLIAVVHVLGRHRRRGGALAVGGLLLAIGGMAASIYGPALGGRPGAMLVAMGGGTDRYRWETTAMIVGLAVLSEIVLAFVRTSSPAPKREPEPAEAGPTSRS